MSISFTRTATLLCAPVALLAGCSAGSIDPLDNTQGVATAAITAQPGGHLAGITDEDFAVVRENFMAVESIADGVGPVFNELACGACHTLGAIGGSGEQIERRFGQVTNGVFHALPNRGGTLRQLQTVGSFVNDGRACNVPVEREPNEATVHNVGRLTTPLFGLGLVDAMPDAFFRQLAAAEPNDVRGTVKTVRILLPNPTDASQSVGSTRVARFGWKADIANLATFSADAYLNEMGITTQHCVAGQSVLSFATESAPNGVAMPVGCDDLAPPAPDGVPAGTDDAVGPCDPGETELQDDIQNFLTFMTFLAPTDRDFSDLAAINAGQPLFTQVGCADCHTTTTFRTPATTPNGVPGNFAFNPFSDFLVHDMGALGDQIGNEGDSVATTRLMRTAPLWGIRFRNHLLHDGRTGDVETAVRAHAGQATRSVNAFTALNANQRHAIVQFVRSL